MLLRSLYGFVGFGVSFEYVVTFVDFVMIDVFCLVYCMLIMIGMFVILFFVCVGVMYVIVDVDIDCAFTRVVFTR